MTQRQYGLIMVENQPSMEALFRGIEKAIREQGKPFYAIRINIVPDEASDETRLTAAIFYFMRESVKER